ncbi:MAG: hypothetical protein ACYTG7_07275 [Planctomycetota bacterium]|jgi:hypothetical protein
MPEPLKERMMKRLSLACILGAAILLALGCGTPRSMKEELALTKTEFSNVSLLQLMEMLKDFGDRFAFSIKVASNRIVEQHPELEIRKRTVYWKLVTIPNLRQSLYGEAPLIGLVDSWTFCVQMVDYFESGEGKDAFGDLTNIALEISRELEKDIKQLAARAIKQEYYREWQEEIEKFARQYPLSGLTGRYSARPVLLQASESGKLGWVTDLPLAPFRAFMSDTAQAIAEFNMVAERFADQIRFMPDDIQWHLELLLYDIEERDTTRTALKSTEEISSSIHAFSEAAKDIAATVDQLPEEIESRLKSVLEELDAKQEGIQGTLQETRAVVSEAEKAIVQADAFSRSAVEVMENVSAAGEKWEAAVLEFQEVLKVLVPEEEPGAAAAAEESESFNIKDVERTAVKAREAVAELRALTGEVKAFVDSADTGALVRQIVLYVILLVAAFFVLLLAYRISASRLAKRA